MMRAFVIAPAQVQAQLLGTRIAQRMIEGFDVQQCAFAELLQIQIRILDVPSHRQIRTIDLQYEARREQSRVFAAHRLGDGIEVLLLARVEVISKEQGHDPR